MKKANRTFQHVSAFEAANVNTKFMEHFKDKTQVSFFYYNPEKTNTAKSNAIVLDLPMPQKASLELELIETQDCKNYVVTTDKGYTYKPNTAIKHFRGIVKDDTTSVVAITCYGNEIMGMIATQKGNYNIVYDKSTGNHLIYNDKNLKEQFRSECATRDDASVLYDKSVLFGSIVRSVSAQSSSTTIRMVRFYLETEFDIYQARNNSIPAVEAFVTGLYNQVATLYLNDGISTQLSEIHVWTAIDPYTANNIDDLLVQFQNNRTSINGDVGQLLNFRGMGGGKAAGFNALCNSSTINKLSVASIAETFNTLPNYSRTVKVVTHEIGHLLGSRHTHACVWNGNNTAIDGCATPEGSCARPDNPANGGTIMSYCDHPSANSFINFNLGFGEQPRNVIRNNINNATCLPSSSVYFSGASSICNESSYGYILHHLPSNATVQWSASNNSMTLQSGQGDSVAIFRQTGFTNCEIRAAISFNGTVIANVALPVTICQPAISGPSTVCEQGTFTIDNLPQGATVQWSASADNISLLSGQGTRSAVFVRHGSGSVQVRVVIDNSTTLSQTIQLSPESSKILVPQFIILRSLCVDDFNEFYAEYDTPDSDDIIEFEWNVRDEMGYGWTIESHPSLTPGSLPLMRAVLVRAQNQSTAGSVFMKVRARTDCGWSDWTSVRQLAKRNCISDYFMLSPNPADAFVNVALNNAEMTSGIRNVSHSYTIQLWNSLGLVKQVTTTEKSYQMDLSGVPAGFYYVHVIKDGKTYRKQLIVK